MAVAVRSMDRSGRSPAPIASQPIAVSNTTSTAPVTRQISRIRVMISSVAESEAATAAKPPPGRGTTSIRQREPPGPSTVKGTPASARSNEASKRGPGDDPAVASTVPSLRR
jgi:hypothetical protein